MVGPFATRIAVAAVCLLALGGLFVLGGAGRPTPPSAPPSYEDLDRDYGSYVGETVEVAGTVVRTDPTVVEFEYDTGVYETATYRLELEGDLGADVDDAVYVSGEVRPDRSIAVAVDRSMVRDPREIAYMYVISLVAALLVGARLVNGWRFRPRRLELTPRERTLFDRWRGESRA